MSTEEKSFEDLLKDAPRVPNEDTVGIVGTLAKSEDSKRFVLFLADGSSITLDTSAVKKHTVLGHSVGQTIVRIEVDRKHLPAGGSYAARTLASSDQPQSSPSVDLTHTQPTVDVATMPGIDHGTLFYFDTIPVTTAPTRDLPTPVPLGGDPVLGGGALPFSLQLPHHLAAAQVEALNAAAFGGQRTYLTANTWASDHHIVFKVTADPQIR